LAAGLPQALIAAIAAGESGALPPPYDLLREILAKTTRWQSVPDALQARAVTQWGRQGLLEIVAGRLTPIRLQRRSSLIPKASPNKAAERMSVIGHQLPVSGDRCNVCFARPIGHVPRRPQKAESDPMYGPAVA
jgi:hypothetical protein